MRLWRNEEIKRFIICYGVFILCATSVSAFISVVAAETAFVSVAVAVAVLVIGVSSAVIFLVFTKKRYDALNDLSAQIDMILHGDYNINLIPDKEGELALLSSELSKMTLRLREQAEQLEKDKRYLSDSIADISHQLRTPLTSIRMIVPRLGMENQSVDERLANIQKAENLLERTQWLIATLLKIARLESGTVTFAREKVNLHTLVKKVLEPLEILLDLKNIQLSLDVSEAAEFICDELWTVEALGNVLKNGVEHCPIDGRLEVTGTDNPLYTEIIIADNGTGFSPEDISHLFERFYRGNNAVKESAGIGLNLSRMIIVGQNGTIKAENRPGGGAQFQIRFYKGVV